MGQSATKRSNLSFDSFGKDISNNRVKGCPMSHERTLVLPEHADLTEINICVLSPLCGVNSTFGVHSSAEEVLTRASWM